MIMIKTGSRSAVVMLCDSYVMKKKNKIGINNRNTQGGEEQTGEKKM